MQGLSLHRTPSALFQGRALTSPGLNIKSQGNQSLGQHLLETARAWHTSCGERLVRPGRAGNHSQQLPLKLCSPLANPLPGQGPQLTPTATVSNPHAILARSGQAGNLVPIRASHGHISHHGIDKGCQCPQESATS